MTRDPPYLSVANWSRFQHYRDRSPLWIKVYCELLDEDDDFLALPDATKAALVMLWLFAARRQNRIPNDPEFLQPRLGLQDPPDLDLLRATGWLVPYEGDAGPYRHLQSNNPSAKRPKKRVRRVTSGDNSAAPKVAAKRNPTPASDMLAPNASRRPEDAYQREPEPVNDPKRPERLLSPDDATVKSREIGCLTPLASNVLADSASNLLALEEKRREETSRACAREGTGSHEPEELQPPLGEVDRVMPDTAPANAARHRLDHRAPDEGWTPEKAAALDELRRSLLGPASGNGDPPRMREPGED